MPKSSFFKKILKPKKLDIEDSSLSFIVIDEREMADNLREIESGMIEIELNQLNRALEKPDEKTKLIKTSSIIQRNWPLIKQKLEDNKRNIVLGTGGTATGLAAVGMIANLIGLIYLFEINKFYKHLETTSTISNVYSIETSTTYISDEDQKEYDESIINISSVVGNAFGLSGLLLSVALAIFTRMINHDQLSELKKFFFIVAMVDSLIDIVAVSSCGLSSNKAAHDSIIVVGLVFHTVNTLFNTKIAVNNIIEEDVDLFNCRFP